MCVVVFFVVVVVAFFSVGPNSAHFEAHSCASLASGALGGSKPSRCSTVAMSSSDGVECGEKEDEEEDEEGEATGGATVVCWDVSRQSDAKRATEGAFHGITDDTEDNVDSGVDTDGIGIGAGVSGCGRIVADVEVGVSSIPSIVGSTV